MGLVRLLSRSVLVAWLPLAEADAAAPDEISSAFESTVCMLTAKPGEATITAEWSFTNHWDFPLQVEKFNTSCGCLAAAEKQPTLQPGQSGKLTAAFTPGQHRGLLRKSLHLRFVGHEGAVELVAEATIPSHVEVSTQEHVWQQGEDFTPKAIEITSGTGKPFTITNLPGLPENQFVVTQETITEGTHYRLHITPTAAASGQHCLQVRTDSPDPRDAIQAVFLRVDPPKP